jgi:hypothetical protein
MTVNDPYPSLDWLEHQWQVSAKNGRSLGPLAMAAYGSESGHWANTQHTSAGDLKLP